jgi:hypothetical protein
MALKTTSKRVYHWEAANLIQTPEYNRAKANYYPSRCFAVSGTSGEYDNIIANGNRQETSRPTLDSYIAPALEAKQQYQQAFVVIFG